MPDPDLCARRPALAELTAMAASPMPDSPSLPPPAPAAQAAPDKRSFPMSVTSRILLMLVILAVGIAVVFALTLQGLRRTNQALQQLSSVEMEQLIASTRVMQQSEMIGSYARLVAITNDIGERRLNMVELTDRMGWLDKLLGEMTQTRLDGAIDPLMQSKRNALNANVQQLSQAIFQPAQHGLDDRPSSTWWPRTRCWPPTCPCWPAALRRPAAPAQ
ncbi:hypothetical protein [Comamonas sp. JC664]|uniref:hypothetical protein n=1 Tax=Comamonas sp. JC664 TaxID=2801917 RepID=UPI00361234B8